jgi:predicted dehydrogenase
MDMYYSKYSGTFELVHDIDLAIWFAGQDIKRVEGVYGSFSEMGMDSPDTVEMLIEFENKCVANVHLDFFQTPRRRTIDLIGWDGVMQIEFASWDEAHIRYYNKKNKEWKTLDFKTQRNDMFVAEDTEFLDCVLEDKPVSIDIMEGLKASAAIESIYKI